MIEIYTDGSAKGNPGPGGYGVILRFQGREKEISQGYKLTTNNRMELLAVIVALEALKVENRDVTVYSDSKYVIDAVVNKWVWGWQKKGFSGKKNPDLWMRFLKVYSRNNVKFVWVRGHNGHVFNERCDKLAVAASETGMLLTDEGYKPEN